MKRTTLIALIITLCANLAMAQMGFRGNIGLNTLIGKQISETLNLNTERNEAFLKIYSEYNEAMKNIHGAKPHRPIEPNEQAAMDNDTIDKQIREMLDNSVRATELKREYYTRFREVLSPREVLKMYDLERRIRDKAIAERRRRMEGMDR